MGRTARTGPAHRDRGGDRLRERITREQLMESTERYGKSPYGLQSASSRQFFLPVCPSPVVPDIRFPIFKCSNDVLIQLAT